MHVVENPYGPVVKRKCISLHQLQYFNVFLCSRLLFISLYCMRVHGNIIIKLF